MSRIDLLKIGGSVVVIIAGIVWIGSSFTGGREVQTVTIPKPVACAECDYRGHMNLGEPPVACPDCGEQAIWPAAQCENCERIVAFDPERFRDREAASDESPVCPHCGEGILAPIREPYSVTEPSSESAAD